MPTDADFLDLQKRLIAVERLLRAGIPTNVVGGGLPDATDGTVFGQIPKTGEPPNEEHGIPEALSTPELGTAGAGGGSLTVYVGTNIPQYYSASAIHGASLADIYGNEMDSYFPTITGETKGNQSLISSRYIVTNFLRIESLNTGSSQYWAQIGVETAPESTSNGLAINMTGTQRLATHRTDINSFHAIPEIWGWSDTDETPSEFESAPIGALYFIVETEP